MVLIVGAALAALLRGLVNPDQSYAIGRNMLRIARSGGPGSQLAKAAIQGFMRGGMDEVERVFARAATALEGQMAPLLRRIEMTASGAGAYNTRTYGTAEEGFQAAVDAERVASLDSILAGLNPYVAAIAAGAAVAGAAFEAEHHRHGAIHDLTHPKDAVEDLWHGFESMVEGLWDKVTGHKRKTPEPESAVSQLDDFAGIQYTFYNPPSGRIIGYKGIRRFGRNFSKQTTGKHARSYRYDLDSARPVSRIRPE